MSSEDVVDAWTSGSVNTVRHVAPHGNKSDHTWVFGILGVLKKEGLLAQENLRELTVVLSSNKREWAGTSGKVISIFVFWEYVDIIVHVSGPPLSARVNVFCGCGSDLLKCNTIGNRVSDSPAFLVNDDVETGLSVCDTSILVEGGSEVEHLDEVEETSKVLFA